MSKQIATSSDFKVLLAPRALANRSRMSPLTNAKGWKGFLSTLSASNVQYGDVSSAISSSRSFTSLINLTWTAGRSMSHRKTKIATAGPSLKTDTSYANGIQATGLPQVQNKLCKSCLPTTLFASFSYSLTSSQCKRTELTMTSKESNLNAGLNRHVWKEGENWTPTDFCATVSSTPQRERTFRFPYLGCNQLCIITWEWYERFSNMTDCQMGSDFGKILNRPKEMNAVCTKVLLQFFPPVCPFALSIFSQVTPSHVLHSLPYIIRHVLHF